MSWFSDDKPKRVSIWESVEIYDRDYRDERDTPRLKVPGGWIVRERVFRTGMVSNVEACAVSTIFISDVNHEWRLK